MDPAPTLHVFWEDGMLVHDPGPGVFDMTEAPPWIEVQDQHPENADRVRNMLSMLRRGPLAPFVQWVQGQPATAGELTKFHSEEYIKELVDADQEGGRLLCAGTRLARGSLACALMAAGTTTLAARKVVAGEVACALALVRPPGHHAQPTMADGYCFLNNAGIAIEAALEDPSISRVAVVDIDVHYGNGTAAGFYGRADVLTISMHMHHGSWGPSHPQSGLADEVGGGEGIGYNVNVVMPNGSGNRSYAMAFDELVRPAVEGFKPDLIVGVLGQDANAYCPNGRCCLTMDGFRDLGAKIRSLADSFCPGKLLLVQEGGYQLTYAAYCLMATLEGVLGLREPLCEEPLGEYPEDVAPIKARIEEVKGTRAAAIAAAKQKLGQ